ncbi:hypothetical protein BJ987_002290 [Nocardia goodfellowii]|uniref:Uncharacterized protein n=1 Tax=Nocardia goodfellowii TaxID=882446 RepID=A0ABS4QCF6_9NOCA|nr:hypothetical protein [Nocardia goodfellowii]
MGPFGPLSTLSGLGSGLQRWIDTLIGGPWVF